MTQSALVPCPKCQTSIPVEFRHAGQDRTCPNCQHVFASPKLRELKLLVPAAASDSRRVKPERSGSHPLRNFLFVFGLGTALLAGIGTYLIFEYSKTTLVFDEKNTKAYLLEEEKNLDSMKPAELWDGWDTILEARELPAWELMGTENLKRYSDTLRWAVRILGGVTIAGLLCLVSSFFMGRTPLKN